MQNNIFRDCLFIETYIKIQDFVNTVEICIFIFNFFKKKYHMKKLIIRNKYEIADWHNLIIVLCSLMRKLISNEIVLD